MGTRSLTTVVAVGNWKGKDWKEKIVTMYRQMDGYPEGMGVDLAEFLETGTMVNGINITEKETVFNGASCLAASMVAHFKDGPGGYYLHRGGTTNCGEEYRYEVIVNDEKQTIQLKVIEVGYVNKQDKYVNRSRTIFQGTPKDFLKSALVVNED